MMLGVVLALMAVVAVFAVLWPLRHRGRALKDTPDMLRRIDDGAKAIGLEG
jgi:hypothetical protein